MGPETWASIAAAVAAVAGGFWTQRAASRANRETAVVTQEPAHRAEDRAVFESIKKELKEQKAELRASVLELQMQIEDERAGRRQDQRTQAAILRYVRRLLAVLREHEIPPPAPDAGDEPELAAHGIP